MPPPTVVHPRAAIENSRQPLPEGDARRALARARRRATALLGVVVGVFLALSATGRTHGAWGYLQAAAEASAVGGLADWFAVTALFRRPLGLPIPHTAVIVERKDQFGRTLGLFVQEHFLNAEVLATRMREARPATRLAEWLADPANAGEVARQMALVLRDGARLLADEDVHRVLGAEMREAAERVSLSALAGRTLGALGAPDRRDDLFDGLVGLATSVLDDNQDALRRRFRAESPRWVPPAVDDALFDRVLRRLRRELDAMARDRSHPQRLAFHQWVARLETDLQSPGPTADRVRELQRRLLDDAALRKWSTALWEQVGRTLEAGAADPTSRLRGRLAQAAEAMGHRLRDDRELCVAVEAAAEAALRSAAREFSEELADLVTGTIARWDARDTADRLELLLGRDLQFIRINGTVVGAVAGLALHGAARVLS